MHRVCETRLRRALSQRIYVLSSVKVDDSTAVYEVMGSQGDNVYTVVVCSNSECTCTCPDYAQRGGFCKHILNVLCKVLRADPATIGKFGNVSVEKASVENVRGDTECCVCYEPLDDKTGKTVPCGRCKHLFHTDCINRWFGVRGNTCPLCRYTMF